VTLSISYRTVPWLLGLIVASFVVQADDYMVLGIMEPLSADLDVGEAAVGQLVTVDSLVYAVGAPVLAVIISGRNKRVLLAAALLVFAVANLGVLVVDSYADLMALRVLAAGAAALILPAALAAAAQYAPQQARGRAMSLVMVGLTAAVVVGVPAGAYLAAVANWRVAFAMCGVVATVAAAQLFFTLPNEAHWV
jgi:predicted MFS family arabinose efflux permease